MCIIIDINCLSATFNDKDRKHISFSSLYNWIYNGDGKIVWGGTKYKEELSKTSYAKIFKLLRDKNKVVKLDDDEVDRWQAEIETIFAANRDFDDPHLIAIVQTSGCQLVATQDRRAIPFLNDKTLYRHGVKPPKIFQGRKKHRKLLCPSNIAKCCKR